MTAAAGFARVLLDVFAVLLLVVLGAFVLLNASGFAVWTMRLPMHVAAVLVAGCCWGGGRILFGLLGERL